MGFIVFFTLFTKIICIINIHNNNSIYAAFYIYRVCYIMSYVIDCYYKRNKKNEKNLYAVHYFIIIEIR